MTRNNIPNKILKTATALLLSGTMMVSSPLENANAFELAAKTLSVSYAPIAINKSSAKLTIGKKLTLKVKGIPENANISWASLDESIAKVNSNGKVTAIKKGKTQIVAIYNGKSYICNITVKSATLNKDKVLVNTGKSFKLKVSGSLISSCATSDKKVATVSNKGVIKGVGAGTATITVTCKNGQKLKCTVTVSDYGYSDLNGMEIIIRDWWSSGDPIEPTNEYEEYVSDWTEYIQDTYNFKIKRQAISDWGSCPNDFVDYVVSGGDDNNYIFVLRQDRIVSAAMSQGLMYDLATIPWLDFTQDKFTRNKTHELYSYGSSTYGMMDGYSEARTGVFFNKDVLKNAGIDPEALYDMQLNGTWTWDEFDNICARVQKSSKKGNVYGLTCNEQFMTKAAVVSNNGSFVGKDKNGYYYDLESANTQEALDWCVDMYNKYDNHDPEGAQWDYYKDEFLKGQVAFLIEDAYFADYYFDDIDFEVGFVMFPKGPKATTYVNCWSNNVLAIPACYSKDKAEKIAFAYNLYSNAPQGYENYKDLSSYRRTKLDSRAIDETISMMMEPEHGVVDQSVMIPSINLGSDLLWSVGPNADITALTESIRDTWKAYVNEVNSDFK